MLIDRRMISQFDWGLFGVSMLIPLLGLVVLYSAGFDPEAAEEMRGWLPWMIDSPTAVRQLMFISGGLLVMGLGLSLPVQALHRYAYALYAVGVTALLGVLLFGSVSHGARRWLLIAGMNVQPAEAMKLGLILAMARHLSKNPPPPRGYGYQQLLVPFLLFCIPMGLIMRQPDLGTAMSVGAVGFAMVLFMGIRWKALGVMALTLALALIPAWGMLHDYQRRRVFVLLDPEADPLGSGYHIIQSKIAVGSGGFLGKGFMRGTQTQLQFLPEHTTDFVFSVLAEEWGFVGSIAVLLLYLFLLYKLLNVVQRSNNLFAALVVVGVAAQIFFHVIVNAGMVVGVLPVVGIPLPLFSYGGSSVLSTMFGLGLALGISMRRLFFVSGK